MANNSPLNCRRTLLGGFGFPSRISDYCYCFEAPTLPQGENVQRSSTHHGLSVWGYPWTRGGHYRFCRLTISATMARPRSPTVATAIRSNTTATF